MLMHHSARWPTALLFPVIVLTTAGATVQPPPAESVRELIATDRAFAAASANKPLGEGVGDMLARDVMVPDVANATFARGRAAALSVLTRDSAAARARLTWRLVGSGVSADGEHGFTFGYTTLTHPDGSTLPGKYVAYWIREQGRWRVSVYRRVAREPGDVSANELPPVVPPRTVAPTADPTRRQQHEASLAAAERQFSRDALGGAAIGAAFARYGEARAMNVGNGPAFVIGPDSIGAMVQAGYRPGTTITWGPDEVRVASSGDLGVSIGTIVVTPPAASGGAPRRIPFFTIWRRDDPTHPWRYIAE